MTDLRKAAQQALDALESCTPGDYSTGHVIHPSFDDDAIDAAITALREALAKPVVPEWTPVSVQGHPGAHLDVINWIPLPAAPQPKDTP